MQLLGCLFLLLFSLAVMILLPILRVGQFLFGWPRPTMRPKPDNASGPQSRTQASSANATQPGSKIFQPGEGEYVDFEEVKDL